MHSLFKITNNNEKGEQIMKKKILVSFIAIAVTLIAGKLFMPPSIYNAVSAQQQTIPAYAKWGRLAMEKVKEKYSTADIIDYLHMGREVGEFSSKERFKLWLRGQDQKEFGVIVTITFDNKTEKVMNIEYKVTDR